MFLLVNIIGGNMKVQLKQLLVLENLSHSEVFNFLQAAYPHRQISVGYNTISKKWTLTEEDRPELGFVNTDTIFDVLKAVS